jgi:hypothetical protein
MTTIHLPRPGTNDDDSDDSDDTADSAGLMDTRAVSRFDVERFAVGELSGERAIDVQRAIDTDPALKAFFDDVKASDAAFLIMAPPSSFMAALGDTITARAAPASWWTRLAGAWSSLHLQMGLGAAAAAVVVVVAVSTPDGPRSGSTSKGGPHTATVGFFVKDKDGARVGEAGEVLHAGDQIQLTVTDADRDAMVVVGIDGSGVVSVYAVEATATVAKGATGPRVLPASLVLDDTVGVERFFVVYGDDAATTERAVRAAADDVARDVKAGRIDLAAVSALDLGADRFAQASIHIRKVR